MTVLVDLDGVVADLDEAFHVHLVAERPDIVPVPPASRRHHRLDHEYPVPLVRSVLATPGFFESLPVVPGAIEGVARLRGAGHHVMFCSIPYGPAPASAREKRRWVSSHFGPAMARSMHLVADKSTVAGDVLIDDFPRRPAPSPDAWLPVLFHQPYNVRVPSVELAAFPSRWPPARWHGWNETDELLDTIQRMREQIDSCSHVEGPYWR